MDKSVLWKLQSSMMVGLDPGIKCGLMQIPQQSESYANKAAVSYGKSKAVKRENVEMSHFRNPPALKDKPVPRQQKAEEQSVLSSRCPPHYLGHETRVHSVLKTN